MNSNETQKLTLFQIGAEMAALDAFLDELGGDVSEPEIEAKIDQWFEANAANLKSKLDSYIYSIRNDEARAALLLAQAAEYEKEIIRLKRLANTHTINAERKERRMKAFLEARQITKFSTDFHELSIKGHGGKLALVVPDEWSSVANAPERYRATQTKTVIILNSELIRREFEDYAMALAEAKKLSDNPNDWPPCPEHLKGVSFKPRGSSLVIK